MQVLSPEIAALRPDQYEVISEKVTYRLCQRPGSYTVIKYVRPVVKRLDTQAISCSPPPLGVIESSRADVSFVAGLLVDKFAYHCVSRTHQLKRVWSCTRDEGRPLGVGEQAQASNHCKLLPLRAVVVSVAEKAGQDPVR
jgi:hypothetical protein